MIHREPTLGQKLLDGSLKALCRASFPELRQFLPRQKAEVVIAALSVSAIAETEHPCLTSSITRNQSIMPAPI